MDSKLLGLALRYHGVDLLHSINKEQQEQPPLTALAFMNKKLLHEPEIKDPEFHRQLCSFIGRKSDILFKPEPPTREENAIKDAENIDDAFAIMPAVETFMNVSFLYRREHFLKSLRKEDCLSGEVVAVQVNGLRIRLMCVDRGCLRDIDDLDIQAFCPVQELPKLYPDESALKAFQEKDMIRGIVLMVNPDSGIIIITLQEKYIPDKNTFPRIGLITEVEFPIHYRRKKQIRGMDYDEMLHSILGFRNVDNVQVLRSLLGIREGGSYMRYLSRLQIPEKEYMEGLRKWQSQKLAHQSVAQGVDMFKEGKHLEAMQFFNKALQIDKQNVEALVARGALYANKESFTQAIQDFEDALAINPNHSNAKNYLIETLLSFGKMCEDKGQVEESIVHYTHALKIEPEHSEARELLAGCQPLLIVQSIHGKGKNLAKSIKPQSEVFGKQVGNLAIIKAAEKLQKLIHEGEPRKSTVSHSPQSGARSPTFFQVGDKSRRKIEGREETNGEYVKGDLRTKKPENDQGQASSLTSGFLPVSSFEYFSDKTAIPGLGSPLPSGGEVEEAKPAVEHSLPEKQIENDGQPLTMQRRDEYLMAEREKFYKDHKERFKRFRPNSASPETSHSPHSPETSKRRKSRDRSRSESTRRALEKKSDKELNMYIEGASKLLEVIKSSSEKDPEWNYVSQIFSKKVVDSILTKSTSHHANTEKKDHEKVTKVQVDLPTESESLHLPRSNKDKRRVKEKRSPSLSNVPKGKVKEKQSPNQHGRSSRKNNPAVSVSQKQRLVEALSNVIQDGQKEKIFSDSLPGLMSIILPEKFGKIQTTSDLHSVSSIKHNNFIQRTSRSLSSGRKQSRSSSMDRKKHRSRERSRHGRSKSRDKRRYSRSSSRDRRRYSRNKSRENSVHNKSRERKGRSRSRGRGGRYSRNKSSNKERSGRRYRTITQAKHWPRKARTDVGNISRVIIKRDPKLSYSGKLEEAFERKWQETLKKEKEKHEKEKEMQEKEKEKQEKEKKSLFDSFFEGGTKNEIGQSSGRGTSSGGNAADGTVIKITHSVLKSKWDVQEVASTVKYGQEKGLGDSEKAINPKSNILPPVLSEPVRKDENGSRNESLADLFFL